MAKSKENKILVTAGPTWVRIDRVRVLTNIFSGRTGFLIARRLREMGFSPTLLLGAGRFEPEDKKLKVIRFKYFEELRELVSKELKDKNYRAVVHSAAVSDFMPIEVYQGKISSSRKELLIKLKPAPKIIKEIRLLRPDIYLIQFKLEVGRKKEELIEVAYASLLRNKSDVVVANDLEDMSNLRYRAYIIDKDKNIKVVRSRQELADNLANLLGTVLLRRGG